MLFANNIYFVLYSLFLTLIEVEGKMREREREREREKENLLVYLFHVALTSSNKEPVLIM